MFGIQIVTVYCWPEMKIMKCYLLPNVLGWLEEMSWALEDWFPVPVTSFSEFRSFPVRDCTTGCPLMFVALIISWLNSWESGNRFVWSEAELFGCWAARLMDCWEADTAVGLLNWWTPADCFVFSWVELWGIWIEAFDDSVAVLTLSAFIPANKFSNSA